MSKIKSEEKNCKRCKRIFRYYGFGHMYCPECAELDRKVFDKVKSYIYEMGPSNIGEIATGTGVDEMQIEIYLREGRLEVPENSSIFIKCEECGIEMRSGRYCPTCAARIHAEWNCTYNYAMDEVGELRKKSKPSVKMHSIKAK